MEVERVESVNLPRIKHGCGVRLNAFPTPAAPASPLQPAESVLNELFLGEPVYCERDGPARRALTVWTLTTICCAAARAGLSTSIKSLPDNFRTLRHPLLGLPTKIMGVRVASGADMLNREDF